MHKYIYIISNIYIGFFLKSPSEPLKLHFLRSAAAKKVSGLRCPDTLQTVLTARRNGSAMSDLTPITTVA